MVEKRSKATKAPHARIEIVSFAALSEVANIDGIKEPELQADTAK